ncbi:DUF192 domain-containing protein [Mastigocoleus testarum]|uniref:DUF192 domain-containing protein n=1 Tax=Mastigocoleus testarum BC008 TaxID=371196 RepID=A0A0V7ZTA9_9CYAN|nr:DUF192 domain-containing protein [Mastigocoleus testarum]KST67885.1 hypothetical protein BC008_31365 [Mastigocoleus testarum BC008]
MFPYLSILLLVLNILLIGCSNLTVAENSQPLSTPALKSNVPIAKKLGQQLPISAIAITPDGAEIQLEVARTPQEQAMGLMYRPALPDKRGMLFVFPSPQPARFWMKNVPVPLDMVFMLNGVVQYIAADVPPCESIPCPTYGPRKLIDQVIELRAGHTAELNLKPGDRITIRHLNKK